MTYAQLFAAVAAHVHPHSFRLEVGTWLHRDRIPRPDDELVARRAERVVTEWTIFVDLEDSIHVTGATPEEVLGALLGKLQALAAAEPKREELPADELGVGAVDA